MIRFSAPIEKFGAKGEKSGWTYVMVPSEIAEKIKPGMRQSYRVRGLLDECAVEHLALIPMGEGDFIIPLKTEMRRKLGKQKGATLQLCIEADDRPLPMSEDFLECLQDEPRALEYFNSLPPSHQRYYSKWIEEAKTDATKTRRIVQAIKGLSANLDFGSMIRFGKQ